jgi:hypothetical protein
MSQPYDVSTSFDRAMGIRRLVDSTGKEWIEEHPVFVAARVELAELRRDRQRLRHLLAVLHRDGGQHTERVGIEQSVIDATTILERWLASVQNADPTPRIDGIP